MTTTQRPRPQRPTAPAPNPASRGLILVAVAVVLGAILLIKGGGIGFDEGDGNVKIDSGNEANSASTTTTSTTLPAPSTSVPPASLKVVALNGAGIDGYAAGALQFLGVSGGYTSATAATALNQTQTTIVHFAPGFDADATAIATLLGLEATAVQPLPEGTQLARNAADVPADTNVVVVLGPDVRNTLEASGAGTTTTTTTITTG